MISVLLDTHIALWALCSPEKLTVHEKQVLQSSETLYVSAVSIWEISLKVSTGKLSLGDIIPFSLPTLFVDSGFQVLELLPSEAGGCYQLPFFHQDPFDRLLVWQAIQRQFWFLTRDLEMKRYQSMGLLLA